MDLSGRLREVREQEGLTQKQMAKIACVHPNTYQGWERGSEPSLSSALLLADHFGMTVEELIGRKK